MRRAVLPHRLIRVEYEVAVGWPTPERRRVTARNFTTDQAASRQLAVIERLPSHCKLLGVWETTCEWTPIDVATIEERRAALAAMAEQAEELGLYDEEEP